MPGTAAQSTPLLALSAVTKRFGGVEALRGVDFDLERGEIHALLGENGAGKSTLIKILAGVHAADSGSLRLDGVETEVRSVADASRLGIRVIHQELSLAPNLSIAENIYMGMEPGAFGMLHRRRMYADAADLVESLGLGEIRDVRKPVSALSIAHRQLVEIARALSRKARVLILDEPTSSLSRAETEALFATLRRLRSGGTGILYISHRLEEILRIADRITVLRDGRSVGVRKASQVDQKELVKWMVAREISDHFHRPRSTPGEPVLEVRGLKNPWVRNVSLAVRRGEILGVAGLVGAGRSELARAIFGLDRVDGGQVFIEGRPVAIQSPRDALRAGIVLVPEDRRLEGLIMIQSLSFNLALPWTRLWCRGVFPDLRLRRAVVDRAIGGFHIKARRSEDCIATLSGGNQQKALVGRWMERKPKVLILDDPTRGVDVGAREEMFAILSALVEDGMAVVLISSDLAEVLSSSHRVAIYREGRILDTVEAGAITLEDVMARLTGAREAPSRP